MTTAPSSSARDQEAITHAIGLLDRLVVSTWMGSGVTGELSHVMIDPLPNEDSDTCRLRIMCFAAGNRSPAWKGVPILVLSEDDSTESVVGATRLNSTGMASLDKLSPGEYQLAVSAHWFFSDQPLVMPTAGHDQVPEALAAAESPDENVVPWPELPPACKTNDGRAIVTPLQTDNGALELACESTDPAMSEALVRFAVVYPSGEIECAGRLVLKQIPDRQGYHARWKGSVTPTEPCHLLVQVFPLAEPSAGV